MVYWSLVPQGYDLKALEPIGPLLSVDPHLQFLVSFEFLKWGFYWQLHCDKAEKRKQQKEQEKEAFLWEESDETFAYIAGYTSGGAPYGVTWEEWDDLDDGGSTGGNRYNKDGNELYINEEELQF